MLENFNWLLLILGSIIVVGITEYLNGINKENKLPKLRKVFPVFIAFVSGLIISIIEFKAFLIWQYLLSSLLILAVSVIAYEGVLKLVKKLVGKVGDNIQIKKADNGDSVSR